MVGSTELEFEIKPEPPVFSGLNKTDRHQLHNIDCEAAFFFAGVILKYPEGTAPALTKISVKIQTFNEILPVPI